MNIILQNIDIILINFLLIYRAVLVAYLQLYGGLYSLVKIVRKYDK